MNTQKIFFILGALLAGMAVAAGAYGAHAGAEYLSAEGMITYGKAVRYQMHHALALFAVVWALSQWPGQAKLLTYAGWLFVSGIILFSFGLYWIALGGVNLGYITPVGGVAFMGGWLLLALTGWREYSSGKK